MRHFSALFFVVTVSCATSPASAPRQELPAPAQPALESHTSKSTTQPPAEPEPAVVMEEQPRGYAMPPLKTAATTNTEAWGCAVATKSKAVRKHLGIDDMGPTASAVMTSDGHGFLSFEADGDTYAAYICELRSADSDECDGAVVQVAELVKVVGKSTKVLWRSEPFLGSGNAACGKTGGNMFTDLALGDYDEDGKPDVRFSVMDPVRPHATVRLFNGMSYVAMLPTDLAEVDLCRPTGSLVYTAVKKGQSKGSTAKSLPPAIKHELGASYVKCAECPEAE